MITGFGLADANALDASTPSNPAANATSNPRTLPRLIIPAPPIAADSPAHRALRCAGLSQKPRQTVKPHLAPYQRQAKMRCDPQEQPVRSRRSPQSNPAAGRISAAAQRRPVRRARYRAICNGPARFARDAYSGRKAEAPRSRSTRSRATANARRRRATTCCLHAAMIGASRARARGGGRMGRPTVEARVR